MVTRWEVQDAVFASNMEPAGRHLMHALIAKATGNTVTVPSDHAPNYDELAEMTGLSRSTVSEWMKVLAAAGWFERDGSGRAASGYTLAVGDPDAATPKRASRRNVKKAISPPGGPIEVASSHAPVDAVEGSSVRQADRSAHSEGPSFGPPSGTKRSAERTKPDPPGGPKSKAPIRNLPTGDAVPTDSPSSPSPGAAPVNDGHASTPGWKAADKKTGPPAVVAQNAPKPGRQGGLFSVKGLKLTEAQEIVQGWGRLNGYPDATDDDIRAIYRLIQAAFPGKATVPYLRGIAKPEGSGFAVFFEQVRKARAEQVEAQIKALEAEHPECKHGNPAGNQLHPIHGTQLCPLCRRGAPVREAKVDTHPDIVATITAYRAGFDGPLSATEVVVLTQQATAFQAEGATKDQLIELARRAAPRGESLFVAATREDA